MKTSITLKGLHFHANHGYYEEERLMGSPFILNVCVKVDDFDSKEDDIKDTINYEDIYNICGSEMKNTQKLLETVVLNIVSRIRDEFPQIIEGEVSLEKIGPQLGGKVDKAIISMEF